MHRLYGPLCGYLHLQAGSFFPPQLCLDLIDEWMSENLNNSVIGGDGGDLGVADLATYQPFDGLMELKVVIFPPSPDQDWYADHSYCANKKM